MPMWGTRPVGTSRRSILEGSRGAMIVNDGIPGKSWEHGEGRSERGKGVYILPACNSPGWTDESRSYAYAAVSLESRSHDSVVTVVTVVVRQVKMRGGKRHADSSSPGRADGDKMRRRRRREEVKSHCEQENEFGE